ncbi:hypothetical protein SAMN05518801_103136 [Novosphingobium sp. CF614]|uniref:hypothetical protein n=1 Tax=Novosphingobium sp. CF614 TaxID=1884364 RepID=UPI0008E69A25|nr:hypothetical protein [Novosphingobium sp. CF614]SFF91411.1 hypothetical protein SAMN05518801_103136 [Novosphingobium sp. CF614]
MSGRAKRHCSAAPDGIPCAGEGTYLGIDGEDNGERVEIVKGALDARGRTVGFMVARSMMRRGLGGILAESPVLDYSWHRRVHRSST